MSRPSPDVNRPAVSFAMEESLRPLRAGRPAALPEKIMSETLDCRSTEVIGNLVRLRRPGDSNARPRSRTRLDLTGATLGELR